MMLALLAWSVVVGLPGPAAWGAEAKDRFVIRTSARQPDAVTDAIKAYAERQKWLFLGANEVKQNQVTLIKICPPAVGRKIWPLGLHLSAMLPCGNLGVYQKDGVTEVSLLDPHDMELLHPDPAVTEASAIAATALTEMLDTVTE
jgi:hypothetical protein